MLYKDKIHGDFKLPLHIEAIVKTDEFQRLRGIKQVGFLTLIYPEASHTRYEHCIGTYFLSRKMIECLENNSRNLNIPKMYKECICIAALLHDIGHGPFSHFWERINTKVNHEQNSFPLIDSIFEKIATVDGLKLSECNEEHEFGVDLIKSLIDPHRRLKRELKDEFKFIFEIVSNKQCDLDVDKWDYLKRDAFHLDNYRNFSIDIDFDEVFTGAKVSADGAHIEYNYEHYDKIYKLFDARSKFHIHLYQTPLSQCMENIIHRLIKSAVARGKLKGSNGQNISEIHSQDLNEFLQLTDDYVWKRLKELNDPETVYLLSAIEEGKICEIIPENNNNGFHKLEDYLIVNVKIENAGEKMNENGLRFHGDERRKPTIEKKMGFYERTHYFGITK